MDELLVTQANCLADQLMNAADHAHVEAVVGQYFGELRFTDGADGGHEVDTVIVNHVFERFHTWQCAFDAQLHQVVGQQATAATAAKGAFVDRLGGHVVKVVGDRRNDATRNDKLATWHVAHA